MITIESLEYIDEIGDYNIPNTQTIIYAVNENMWEVLDKDRSSLLSPSGEWVDSNSAETMKANFRSLQDAIDAYNKTLE